MIAPIKWLLRLYLYVPRATWPATYVAWDDIDCCLCCGQGRAAHTSTDWDCPPTVNLKARYAAVKHADACIALMENE